MKKILIIIATLLIISIPTSAYGAAKTYDISDNKNISIDEGKNCTLTVPPKYKNIKWSSNNKKVVTVSKNGVLSAVNGGKATITAKSGNKTFKCYITVNEDYSEWVLYDTGDLETLLDNIADGYVVRMNGQYYCSPEYFEMISNAEIVYENDISEGENYDNGSILTPDAEFKIRDDKGDDEAEAEALKKRIQDMINNGKATSE